MASATGSVSTPVPSRVLSTLASLSVSLFAVLVAVIAGGLVMRFSGFHPLQTYAVLFRGAFGSLTQWAETLKSATPLLLIGLGIALAFQAGAFNIGAVGQMYLGALLAVMVGARFEGLPAPLHVLLATAAAAMAGGIWASICSVLKTRYGANEVITTILLNYVAIHLIDFMISGPIQAPDRYGTPISWPVLPAVNYAKLIPHSQLHAGFLLAVAAVPLSFLVMRYTTLGHRIRMVGLNPEAARYAGVRVHQTFFTAFFISGALAGLAGGVEILGYRNRLTTGFAPSTGYDAIAVALLGQFHPAGVALSAIFFGALSTGATALEATARVPSQLVDIVRVLAILAVLGATSPAVLGWTRGRRRKPAASQDWSSS